MVAATKVHEIPKNVTRLELLHTAMDRLIPLYSILKSISCQVLDGRAICTEEAVRPGMHLAVSCVSTVLRDTSMYCGILVVRHIP